MPSAPWEARTSPGRSGRRKTKLEGEKIVLEPARTVLLDAQSVFEPEKIKSSSKKMNFAPHKIVLKPAKTKLTDKNLFFAPLQTVWEPVKSISRG